MPGSVPPTPALDESYLHPNIAQVAAGTGGPNNKFVDQDIQFVLPFVIFANRFSAGVGIDQPPPASEKSSSNRISAGGSAVCSSGVTVASGKGVLPDLVAMSVGSAVGAGVLVPIKNGSASTPPTVAVAASTMHKSSAAAPPISHQTVRLRRGGAIGAA